MSDMVSADEAQGLLDGTTPGPWDDVRVGHEGDGSARSHEEQVCGIDAQAVAIVTHDGSAEARANTRLMYAAPDLAETVVALHARREDQEAACRGHMAVCRLYEQRAETLRAERDALRAVVAALPICTHCAATATREAPNLGAQYYCDDHAPSQPWTAMDLPYAAALRAWRGAR